MKQALVMILLAACTSATPRARPHDMSAAQHDQAARQEDEAARQHLAPKHQDIKEQHRRAAADHRAASAALRDAEAKACTGLDPDERDMSPFERSEEIASVEPLIESRPGDKTAQRSTVGVRLTFKAVPGLTQERLQKQVDCHLARAAALGHDVPEMPDCPLVPNGAEAQVLRIGNRLAVEIRANEPKAANEIVARADRLTSR